MTEKKKLTASVDEWWIEGAKEYARTHNPSLSRLISEYLRKLVTERSGQDRPQVLQRLSGILPADVSVDEHRKLLIEKYGA